MANLKMDKNPDTGSYDLYISQGSPEYVEKVEEISQRLVYSHMTWFGEWFLDRREGFPWKQLVFTKPFDVRAIEDQLVLTCLNTNGVIEMIDSPKLILNESTRVARIEENVRTTEGQTLFVFEGGV